MAPGSDWDLRLLREHRETLALEKWVSRAPSDLPFVIYLSSEHYRAFWSSLNKPGDCVLLGVSDSEKIISISFAKY